MATRLLAALLLCGAVASAVPAPAEPAASPRAVVEQLLDAVRRFKDEKKQSLTPSERAQNEAAKKLANETLAIAEVSERALGDYWQKLSPAQRTEFVDLVRALFERVAYPKSSSFFGDLTIEFCDERVSGDQATVRTVVRHPKEGVVSIDYKLERSGNHWIIYDILLDDVSLALDLQSQVQKILREESYARLLQRMREKLNES